ncbi:MAG: glycosyltransferase family 4 protein [Candidatus Bathyarchaeia archaeon]
MRIAVFTPYLYPFQIDMLEILRGITSTKLFTLGIYGNYPFEEFLRYTAFFKPVIRVLGQPMFSPLDILRFIRWKPNAVIIYGAESISGLCIFFISKLIGAKTLVIVEENNITSLNSIILGFIQKIKRAIVKFVYEFSDIIVAESSASKKYVEEMLHVRRRTKHFSIYPHGVNVKHFSKNNHSKNGVKAKELLLRSLGLSKDLIEKLWICFIGELSYIKGTDVLIDAIEILKERNILRKYNCVFFLPRRSRFFPDRYDLKHIYLRKLSKLVREGYVVLYPPLAYSEMPILYRSADIVVLPSRFLKNTSSDRSPNVALETLATGSLLVASYAGGIPDIVGDAGLLVKPNDPYALADKIEKVVKHYEKYQYLKERARVRAVTKLDIRLYTFTLLKNLCKTMKKTII